MNTESKQSFETANHSKSVEFLKEQERELGVVFPCGALRISADERAARLNEIAAHNFHVRLFEPETESEDGYSAGHALERAILFSQALTLRRYPILWVGKGGYGSTTILSFLEDLLPPVLPDKMFFGYSDASFIGLALALRYSNFTYVMGANAFEKDLFAKTGHVSRADLDLSLALLRGESPAPVALDVDFAELADRSCNEITGLVTPLNLSLAESLVCLQGLRLPRGRILFIEDINEDLFRVLRKIDSLANSGFLAQTEAIVLGDFSNCPDQNNSELNPRVLAQLIGKRTGLPTFVFPYFGHASRRLPLVCGAKVAFELKDSGQWQCILHFEKGAQRRFTGSYFTKKSDGHAAAGQDRRPRVHFLGIGGTGMTAVAGLAKKAGFKVTGSDGPIYPPMSNVLAALEITPYQSYEPKNINESAPDLVVLANAISRIDASLNRNLEFEHLLRTHIPTMSFPGFLREFFLKDSLNIVVSGTHGKTTTTSAISYALRELDHDPSYLIGGAPKDFENGFFLGRKKVFVIEGDEYDTALFDKGPKFLSYEPRVTVINNIEFDHADIYPNIQAICDEFGRLAQLTAARKGIVIANTDDANVTRLLTNASIPCIGFGSSDLKQAKPKQFQDMPHWLYLGHTTRADGIDIKVLAPNGIEYALPARLFGKHNALNLVAALATLHAFQLLSEKSEGVSEDKLSLEAKEIHSSAIERWCDALKGFSGVKRRFEQLFLGNDIAIFDDFAHHPTAIKETLRAFRDYHRVCERRGMLKVCFDPRNATMRRNILQTDLTESLQLADAVYIGKVAKDLRIPEHERLNNLAVADKLSSAGKKAQAFESSESLLEFLSADISPGDTLVFMSSGSFDQIPRNLVSKMQAEAVHPSQGKHS